MSKKLMIVILLVALAAGGYWFTQKSTNSSHSGATTSALLSRVPADTYLFAGGLKTIPYFNPYDALAMKEMQSSMDSQFAQFQELLGDKQSPAAIVLMNLYKDLVNQFYANQITEINDFAIYALGVYPVAVWKSTDVNTFISQLNAIENNNNITPRNFTLGDAQLREYLIDEEAPVKMYITINADVISLAAMSNQDNLLKLLAGVEFPQQNLANSNTLEDLKSSHQLLPFAMGYLDAHSAMQNLSSNNDNLFKQTLLEVSKGSDMPDFTKDVCFTDAAKIVAKWPRMVFGYRTYDIASNPAIMDAAMIIEHSDKKFLGALKNIIGSVVNYSMDDDLMSMGIGINIDNIAGFLIDTHKDIMNETYQCEDLIEMQQQAAENDPAMLAMGAQMVAGVQGVSVHVTEVDMAAIQSGDMTQFKGLVVITANNPKNLVLAASSFYPPLAEINIEANGQAQPLELPMGISAKIALSEKAVTFQFGDSEKVKNRLADIHQGKGLSPSLFRSGMDLSAYFKLIAPMMSDAMSQASPEEAEQMQQMIKLFETIKMKFVYDINVEEKGIVFKVKMSMEKPQ